LDSVKEVGTVSSRAFDGISSTHSLRVSPSPAAKSPVISSHCDGHFRSIAPPFLGRNYTPFHDHADRDEEARINSVIWKGYRSTESETLPMCQMVLSQTKDEIEIKITVAFVASNCKT
jgi:hypothetical protein